MNNLLNDIVDLKTNIAVVGLGYVGLPLAIEFAKKVNVIGFDVNSCKIDIYINGKDPTNEVGDEAIKNTNVEFTSDEQRLAEARFYIIAVPTPVNDDTSPDLSMVISASKIVGKYLGEGSVVVFESTVYPGLTEEVCIPILEKESGLVCGKSFNVGYSPERVNPCDKIHGVNNVVKIVSATDKKTMDIMAEIYSLIVEAGIYKAESIKIAEAAKIIENSQRDINIAFMNELSIIFNKMGIDTKSVINAAKTKWNFLEFYPGLVGGHCIGVDPYYLAYKAEKIGYHSQIILSGRRINDGMSKYVAEVFVKTMIKNGTDISRAKVAILGFTYKENCPDTRNTKILDIYKELIEYGVNPVIVDPVADEKEAEELYGITFEKMENLKELDSIILAVGHEIFKNYTFEYIDLLYKKNIIKVMFDIKGFLKKENYDVRNDYLYWRL